MPILIDSNNFSVNLFNQNPFFFNWPTGTSNHFLLDYILPTEDIDIINTLNQNIESLENYNYLNIINKYNVKDFIVCLIFQDNDKIKVLSKITINLGCLLLWISSTSFGCFKGLTFKIAPW